MTGVITRSYLLRHSSTGCFPEQIRRSPLDFERGLDTFALILRIFRAEPRRLLFAAATSSGFLPSATRRRGDTEGILAEISRQRPADAVCGAQDPSARVAGCCRRFEPADEQRPASGLRGRPVVCHQPETGRPPMPDDLPSRFIFAEISTDGLAARWHRAAEHAQSISTQAMRTSFTK